MLGPRFIVCHPAVQCSASKSQKWKLPLRVLQTLFHIRVACIEPRGENPSCHRPAAPADAENLPLRAGRQEGSHTENSPQRGEEKQGPSEVTTGTFHSVRGALLDSMCFSSQACGSECLRAPWHVWVVRAALSEDDGWIFQESRL